MDSSEIQYVEIVTTQSTHKQHIQKHNNFTLKYKHCQQVLAFIDFNKPKEYAK